MVHLLDGRHILEALQFKDILTRYREYAALSLVGTNN
jgi:hypothetical protein